MSGLDRTVPSARRTDAVMGARRPPAVPLRARTCVGYIRLFGSELPGCTVWVTA